MKLLVKQSQVAKTRQTFSQTAIANGYRSGLEEVIGEQLKALNVTARYETITLGYTPPVKARKYTPDWVLPNGVIIETKGRFVTADRQKHKAIKAEHPDLDIRFVFSRAKSKLGKGSNTTYADWCDQYGFKYADKTVPPKWTVEPENAAAINAIQHATVKGQF